jgi:hypothetical protein
MPSLTTFPDTSPPPTSVTFHGVPSGRSLHGKCKGVGESNLSPKGVIVKT